MLSAVQQEQRPKIAVVQALNRMRGLLRDVDGMPFDFLKNARHPFSSLGIKLVPSFDVGAQPVANVISECIQGGPAHISGQVEPGDLIIAVDGIPLDYGNASVLLGSSNRLGAPCTLTLQRNGETHEVQLAWTSAVFAHDMNVLFQLFESLESEIRKASSASTPVACLQELLIHTIGMEKNRSADE